MIYVIKRKRKTDEKEFNVEELGYISEKNQIMREFFVSNFQT